MKISFCLIITLLCQLSFARSARPCSEDERISQDKYNKIIKKIKDDAVYKNLTKKYNRKITIYQSYCIFEPGVIKGQISVSGLTTTAFNKKCTTGQMTFNYQILNNNIKYNDITIDDKKVSPHFIDNEFLTRSIETAINNSKTKDFFLQAKLCQLQYITNEKVPYFIMQLRIKEKRPRVCYLRSSLDGKKVAIIKRLYAQDSQCK